MTSSSNSVAGKLHSISEQVQHIEKQLVDVGGQAADIKKKLIELEDEQKKWLATAGKVEKAIHASVKLNVGGMKFMTSLQTLKSQPGSFFEVLLSGKWEVKDTIFIDRDGSMFKYVLDFMRGEPLPLSLLSPLELARLSQDADFYQLGSLIILLKPTPIFSSTHKSSNITIEKDIVFKNDTTVGHGVVLGEQEYNTGIHTFKFLVLKVGRWILFGIGCPPIINVNSYSNPTTYGWAGGNQVYFAGAHNLGRDGYTYNMSSGDTICLTLNCQSNTLSFRNETKGTTTFTMSIPPAGKWRLHVNLHGEGDTVKFIS